MADTQENPTADFFWPERLRAHGKLPPQLWLDRERYLHEALRISKLGLWEVNWERYSLDWSAEAYEVFGQDPSKFKVSNDAFFELVHPEDRDRVRAAVQAAMDENHPYEIVHRIVVKGETRWIWEHAEFVRDPRGKAVLMVGTCQDVTDREQTRLALKRGEEELRAAGQRYRKLVNYSNDGVIIGNAEANAFFASPSVQGILGYTPEELIGTNVFSLIHPDDAPHVQELQNEVLRSPGKGIPATFRGRHKDGHWVWLDAICTNWLDEPGINGLVANFRDITKRIELEQQLQQAVKMEAVGRLAGGVAHDFNNLLTAIAGYTQLLLPRVANDPVSHSHAQQVLAAADRAAGVTRQLLAFSRRQMMQPRVIDLNQRVQEVEKLLLRLIGEDIELKTVLAPGLHHVLADPDQMDQVVMNLVVNARDAMPGGGRLLVETGNVTLDENYARTHTGVKPGPYVMLSVTDTGIGMDQPTRARLFEPFFTTKEKGRGTGLGLATVYGIVNQSGGNIWVYSEPGRGTTFKIYLPATQEHPDTVRLPAAKPVRGGSETVLVAEDEDGVRQLVCAILRDAGYSVIEARNGEDALARCEATAPQLLLTDLVMPGIGGSALASALGGRFPDLRVIYMSGYSEEAIFQQGALSRGVHVLQKPFQPDQLLLRVRKVLDAGKKVKA